MPLKPPKRGLAWLLSETSTYDVGLSLFTAVVGYSSAGNYFILGRPGLGWVLLIATSGAFAIGVIKAGVALQAARAKQSLHELEGCLHTLHAALTGEGGAEDGRLRLTLHSPVGDGSELEQLTDYIGYPHKEGRVGRRFPGKSGIIGRVLREKEPYIGVRISDVQEEFVKELVTEWDYDEWLARLLNPNARAWMAVPFTDSRTKSVDAILYLDSTDPAFFNAARAELINNAATGIAFFIAKRYS